MMCTSVIIDGLLGTDTWSTEIMYGRFFVIV